MIRYSQKELAKNAKTNIIIPEGYKELKDAIVLGESDLAYRLEFIYEGSKFDKWFPKSRTLKIGSKFYASEWIIKIKIEE